MEVNFPPLRQASTGNKVLALFDFDGTLTRKDTLFDFARYARGTAVFWKNMLRLSPVFAARKVGLLSAQAAKEQFLTAFFGGMPFPMFEQLATAYSLERVPQLLRPAARRRMYEHLQQQHRVAIVSASPENWIKPWANLEGILVIATVLEVKNGVITGKLASKNCNGEEKAARVRAAFNLSEYSYIYAYGDTAGDKAMLALADESFFRYFS